MEPPCARPEAAGPLDGAWACGSLNQGKDVSVVCSILLKNEQLVLSNWHCAMSSLSGRVARNTYGHANAYTRS
jgi:hypothetical protein